MAQLPSVPSLYTPILFQARQRPHEIAVVSDSTTITFREFNIHIERITRHLHSLALPPSSRVAVHSANLYMQWLMSIALSRLGLLSAVAAPANYDVLRPDVILTDRPAEVSGKKVLEIGKDWLDKPAEHLPPFVDPVHPPDAPARIILSSGTTGTPKLALFSYQELHQRSRGAAFAYALTHASRLMTTMGITSIGGLTLPLGCWAAGGCVALAVLRKGQPMSHLLRSKPNVMLVSTTQLDSLVQSLPADYAPQQPLAIYVAGSVLPQAVNRRARLRLTQTLIMVYGSTEVGTVTLAPAAFTDARPRFTGYVIPPVLVEIVDENGKPVPHGTTGEVRVRTEGQASLYLDDPETTARTFRDGWFHPGDLGQLGPDGDLTIVGRVRELMNFGGVKITPDAMEEALAGTPGVADMAVFPLGTSGAERPCVAVVPSQGFAEDELTRRFRQAYPRLPAITIFRVDSIPRNDMGKVMRVELASTFAGSNQAATLH
jgi:acyl-coenzyme A synthetase/AMP-(fatty) acid ligase